MIRNRNIRLIIIISSVLLILLIILFSTDKFENLLLLNSNPENLVLLNRKQSETFPCPIQGDKWIVLTTIFYPTPAIYKFLNLTTKWNLIVIADKKTPKDWLQHLSTDSSRLVFLS